MREVFLKRQDSGEKYTLVDRMTLGRHYENDIVLDDNLVSRHHCVLIRDGSGVVVKDLDSSNGIFVNDRAVLESELVDGDRLKVGYIELTVVIVDQAVEQKDTKPTFNSIIFDPYFRKKIVGLHVSCERLPEKEYFLECNSVSTVGRMNFCNIPINDVYVSRNNTTIDVRDHRVMIADVSSKNGTYVNGKRIINSELKDGDSFNVAGEFDFSATFEYDQKNSLDSIAKIGELHTIDLWEDANNLLELYESRYGNQVLLEVERQTHVMCNEVEDLLVAGTKGSSTQQSVERFLQGLSRAKQVLPTNKLTVISGDDLANRMQPSVVQGLVKLGQQPTIPNVVYFEAGYEESVKRAQMNGLFVRSMDDFELLLLGLPIENILYMVYAAGWLRRLRSVA